MFRRVILALSLLVVSVLALACAHKSTQQNGSEGTVVETREARLAQPGTEAKSLCAASHGKVGCPPEVQSVVLAGGCFWGMEDILRRVPGVIDTEVGYAGGSTAAPVYESVKTGTTGHAESVRVVFDSSKLSFEVLLENWFFKMHDPTTLDRQGNDVGTQYRSAIFVSSAEQRKVAEAVKAKVGKSGQWQAPIVTEVVDAGPFTPAEEYHQDYLQKNPDGYTCHYLRE